MAHDIFISYSSKDKIIADAVVSRMESGSIRCWYAPRDIVPGSDWAESITNAISASKILVLIFTQNSNLSIQVLREVAQAVEDGEVSSDEGRRNFARSVQTMSRPAVFDSFAAKQFLQCLYRFALFRQRSDMLAHDTMKRRLHAQPCGQMQRRDIAETDDGLADSRYTVDDTL